MPFKSEAQQRYFNANRAELESKGVDVDEWNQASKGLKLPNKVMKSQDPIHIKPSHKGIFTKKAKKAGMSVDEYARHVLSNRSQFDTKTRAQAQFAMNAKGWNK